MKNLIRNVGIAIATISSIYFVLAVVSPFQILKKTFNPSSVIHNYEYFHDVNAMVIARELQIASWKKLDKTERTTIELEAMKQSCRELVTKYNANSVKVNKSLFKGTSLPNKLNINVCE